jgi:hypothetical protein
MKTFKLYAIVLILLMGFGFARAQVLAPTVIASAGEEYYHAAFGSLTWTLGEPVTETFRNGDLLTQGFHQPYATLVSVSPVAPTDLQVNIYPNPFDGEFTIAVTPFPSGMLLAVYSLQGQKILETPLAEPVQTILLGKVPSGTYLVVIRQATFLYRSLIVEKTSTTH